MPSIEIRLFQRADRDQLTRLVNNHIAAVIPGITVSVNRVMSQLEREPGEPIVDPWVIERRPYVAIDHDAVVAGALLHRFGSGQEVSDSYRNAAQVRWFLCDPTATEAGDRLMTVCLETMDEWHVDRQYAEGELPTLATYGVPESWPHVRDVYARHGFVRRGQIEIILVASLDDLPHGGATPMAGLTLRRTVGACGTRFSALLDDHVVGYLEVELRDEGDPRGRQFGWSDIGNLWVKEQHRRAGIGTWLLGTTADWLRLGGIQRLLTYAWPEQDDQLAFAARHGFRELVRTERGWVREIVDVP